MAVSAPARSRVGARRRGRTITRLSAAAAAMAGLTVGTLLTTWQGTQSAFSTHSDNSHNRWVAGTVALTDDDTGRALVTATNLAPGVGGAHCIAVAYTGNRAADIRLATTNQSGQTGLAAVLDVTIEAGSGGGFGTCDGFTPTTSLTAGRQACEGVPPGTLAYLATCAATWPTALTGWSPATAETRTFRVSWRLRDNTPDSLQNASTTIDLVWEARNHAAAP